MLRVLYELWPITLPTLIYVGWHLIQHLRAKRRGETFRRLSEGPWGNIMLCTLGIAVVCALMLVFSQPENKGVYQPATVLDGKVRDGQVAP